MIDTFTTPPRIQRHGTKSTLLLWILGVCHHILGSQHACGSLPLLYEDGTSTFLCVSFVVSLGKPSADSTTTTSRFGTTLSKGLKTSLPRGLRSPYFKVQHHLTKRFNTALPQGSRPPLLDRLRRLAAIPPKYQGRAAKNKRKKGDIRQISRVSKSLRFCFTRSSRNKKTTHLLLNLAEFCGGGGVDLFIGCFYVCSPHQS